MDLVKTSKSLTDKGYEVTEVDTAEQALAKIKELIPKGASVMNGASVTLEQIGYVDFLKSQQSGWNNLHEKVLNEKDPAKQSEARRLATVSDYYLGSVHALTEEGDFLVGSNTASQLPSIVFNSQNLIFVVGQQKIVPDFQSAMDRLVNYVVPKEDEHMKQKYGTGTALNKILMFKGESKYNGRRIIFIIVKQELGY